MSLKRLSSTLPKIAANVFARKYIALGRIVTHWEDIVGQELADKAQPVKIHYRKPKDPKEKAQASLEIVASSAECALLVYQKDLILERMNQIFGERWITDIKFIHGLVDRPKSLKPRKKSQISAEEEKNLGVMLENIEDMDIKSRLESLGTAILKDRIDTP